MALIYAVSAGLARLPSFAALTAFEYSQGMNTIVKLSGETRALAEKRAREQGFASVEEYVDALIREDLSGAQFEEWMRAEIEAGLASGPSEELTRARLHDMVAEGIARSKPRA